MRINYLGENGWNKVIEKSCQGLDRCLGRRKHGLFLEQPLQVIIMFLQQVINT